MTCPLATSREIYRRHGGRRTDSTLHQESQSAETIPAGDIIRHEVVAVIVYIGDNAVQLQRGLDEASQPQHKQHETADDDYARQEEALRGEGEHEEDEEDAEAAGYDHVGKEPVWLSASSIRSDGRLRVHR